MVCRCLYILLGTGQFCNSSTICWIAKDFALAVLSCCNLVGRPDFALCCTILFGSGSADRPMLTQFNHIVSELQMLLNHDPINVNCVSFVALHRNRRTVWAFWDQNLRAVHPLPFFATPDSHHHVCLAISTIVARRQNLIAIAVNLPQLYLDSKLSTIEPQSLGLQKMRSSIATGF